MYLHKTLKTAAMTRLTPEVSLMPQLAGIAVKDMGDMASSLAKLRDNIICALDLLVTGV